MERAKRTFEEQWHQALDQAEVEPPLQVWVAIDGQLANEQAVGFRKEAYFYKRLAAACLLLFIIGAAFYWLGGSSKIESTIVDEGATETSAPIIDQSRPSVPLVALDDEEDENVVDSPTIKNQIVEERSLSTSNAMASNDLSQNPEKISQSSPSVNFERVQLTSLAAKRALFPSQLEPWKSDHLYGVARTWEVIDDDKLVSPMWAGVSFSAGAFDPGFGGNSGDDLVFASQDNFLSESVAQPIQNQTSPVYAAGQSVAGGINIGKKVSKRVMLSGGLHYSAFNTASATSQLVTDGAENTYALTSETSDSNLENALNQGALRYDGQQVQLTNEYQYLTVPIKAGYVLLDKKFNITLNTGLSSNIRMNSKLVSAGESEELSNDFSTAGSYENVYFNFLTSVEFGYLFKNHYQFLLEPNYNQALTDFTSSDNPNKAKPRNIGVSIGFRYNF
ncbi:hypothetical protein [Reichenbachiella sp.]|uniref:hypothetical protein n=1 Tax=Reichenbachiella sp. TaxID=2184521 RepID=UPI003299803B